MPYPKYNTTTFKEAANFVHCGKYEYTNVSYTRLADDYKIICPKHGEFTQSGKNHLNGHGCNKCGKDDARKIRGSNSKEFIKKAKAKHGNKYQYDKVIYHNSKTKVIVTCKKHGDFEIKPNQHLKIGKGGGCKLCANDDIADRKFVTFESFVLRANATHNSRYRYIKSSYFGMKQKTKIRCFKQGVFEQGASHHVRGSGCPDCAECGFKRYKVAYFYIIETDAFIGFGITNHIKYRLRKHKNNLKKAGYLIKKVIHYETMGYLALDLESKIKRNKEDNV